MELAKNSDKGIEDEYINYNDDEIANFNEDEDEDEYEDDDDEDDDDEDEYDEDDDDEDEYEYEDDDEDDDDDEDEYDEDEDDEDEYEDKDDDEDNINSKETESDITVVNNHAKTTDNSYAIGTKIYNNQITKYQASEQAKIDISHIEQTKFYSILYDGDLLLKEINKDGKICLWKYKQTFHYRSAQGNEEHQGNKQEISAMIESFLNEPIRIVTLKDISKDNKINQNKIEKYIFTYQIPTIENEVFEPKEKEFFTKNGVLYKNLFTCSDYLAKRFDNLKSNITNYDCLIIDILENIANEVDKDKKPITTAIMNWLSFFFQKMESSNIALVLLGNKEITEDIFWKKIIQPIFGNEEYCITIDDDTLKNSIGTIVKNKIFFHIGDFTASNENIQKVTELLKGIFIDGYVISDSKTKKTIPISGQLLITSEQAVLHMEDYYTQFEHVTIDKTSKIIAKLDVSNFISLSLMLKNELKYLDDFSTDLATFCRINEIANGLSIVNKMEKLDKKVDKINLNTQIKEFIYAIKNHCSCIEYFNGIKEKDSVLYDELIYNFKEDMIARSSLWIYFNTIQGQVVVTDNNTLLKILKEEDDLFDMDINKNKQYKKKKRYIISCIKNKE